MVKTSWSNFPVTLKSQARCISFLSQVTGHIRIRAKSQGMALSLGDKINNSQKIRLSATAKKPARASESVAPETDKETTDPPAEE